MNSTKEMTSHPPLPLTSQSKDHQESQPSDPTRSVTHTINAEKSTSLMQQSLYSQTNHNNGVGLPLSGNQIIIHVCDENKKRN